MRSFKICVARKHLNDYIGGMGKRNAPQSNACKVLVKKPKQ
jgi:hypothetical protein